MRLVATVGAVSLGSSFQFGFGTGSLNNLEEVAPRTLAEDGRPCTLLQWSIVVSGFGVGGLVGSMLVALVTHAFGRKTVLLASNGLVLASSCLLIGGDSWPLLFLGRVCIGIVAGIAAGVVPMYFADLAPTALRGAVGTAHQLSITMGTFVAQLLTTPSLELVGSDTRWRYTFAVPLICSAIECAILPTCPESPAYLYRMGGSTAALRKLVELHTAGSISDHIDSMRAEHTFALSESGARRRRRRRHRRHAL